MSKDEKAIRDLIAEWLTASRRGDIERILELMSEDVVFYVTGQTPMRGRDAFAKSFASVSNQFSLNGKSEVLEVGIEGNMAFCATRLTVEITVIATGKIIRRSGNTLSVLRKVEDSRWVLVRDANMLVVEN